MRGAGSPITELNVLADGRDLEKARGGGGC